MRGSGYNAAPEIMYTVKHAQGAQKGLTATKKELTNLLDKTKLFLCELKDQLDITEFHQRINKPGKTLRNFPCVN